MRKILCDGVMAVNEKEHDEFLRVFLLGPSKSPAASFAGETVVEMESVYGDKFLCPLSAMMHMILRHTQVPIWDAINAYAESCGGDTSDKTVCDKRMNAVVAVEKALRGDK